MNFEAVPGRFQAGLQLGFGLKAEAVADADRVFAEGTHLFVAMAHISASNPRRRPRPWPELLHLDARVGRRSALTEIAKTKRRNDEIRMSNHERRLTVEAVNRELTATHIYGKLAV